MVAPSTWKKLNIHLVCFLFGWNFSCLFQTYREQKCVVEIEKAKRSEYDLLMVYLQGKVLNLKNRFLVFLSLSELFNIENQLFF